MIGDPREIERLGRAGELAPLDRLQRPRPAQVEIEARQARGRLNVERFGEAAQFAGERARGLDRPRHFGSEQRTFVDVDDFVRAGAHEADVLPAMRMEPRVKRRAPPSRAVRIDQRADFGLDSGPRERRDERVALPLGIEARAHMLRRAAAAIPEIATDRSSRDRGWRSGS